MIDHEKVIKGLERYINYPEPLRNIVADAIVLLKEQEPIRPVLDRDNNFWAYYKCAACNEPAFFNQKYCAECGRKLEWKE